MNEQFNIPDTQKPSQVADKLYNINEIGNATFINPQKDSSEIPKFLGIQIFHTDVFIGREDELKAVHQKLFEGDNLLLLVNGEGGIGKTTLAAQYYRRYSDEYTHLAWVFAENSIADALLTLAPAFKISFSDQMHVDERLLLLLDTMQQLKKPCLLVIDNANDVKELERYYAALRTCPNFHLLLTTRITELEHATTYRIEPLPDAQAEALFKRYYPNHNESESNLLASILTAVGKNTLIIELLAKTLNSCNRLKTSYSLSNLLGDLQEKGILGVQADEVTTPYHSKGAALRREKPEAIIGAMYDISNLSDAERQVLSVFALLPAESIAFSLIETLLPRIEKFDKSLLTLAQKGWLDYNQPQSSFRVSPVVQEITRAKNPQLLNDCEPLISTLIDKLEYGGYVGYLLNATYEEANIYSRYGESVLHNLKYVDYHLAELAQRVGYHFRTTGSLHKALIFFNTYKTLILNIYDACPSNVFFKDKLATSYSLLGDIYTLLGNVEDAFLSFRESEKLIKELCESEPNEQEYKMSLAISCEKIGEIYFSQKRLEDALEYYEKERDLFEELYKINPQNDDYIKGLALSYEKIGDIRALLKELKEALEYYHKERDLFEKLNKNHPLNMDLKVLYSISYSKLGDTYVLQKDMPNAIKYFDEYARLKKELYEFYPQNLEIKRGLAISFEKIGNIFLLFGYLKDALEYYKEENNLFIELNKAQPENILFKSGLAISYLCLASCLCDLHDKKKYFQMAKEILLELKRLSPTNDDFIKNLNYIDKELKELP